MSNFKKVLDIEKKYDQIISTSKKSLEKEREKFYDNLKLKEEAIKSDFKGELERDYKKSIKDYTRQGEDILNKAKQESEQIFKYANIDDAIKLLEGEIKNV